MTAILCWQGRAIADIMTYAWGDPMLYNPVDNNMAISKENDRHLPFDQAILPLEFGLNDSPLKL